MRSSHGGGLAGISRDGMHKRRSTGGKQKPWRKKRKCVSFSLHRLCLFFFSDLLVLKFIRGSCAVSCEMMISTVSSYTSANQWLY